MARRGNAPALELVWQVVAQGDSCPTAGKIVSRLLAFDLISCFHFSTHGGSWINGLLAHMSGLPETDDTAFNAGHHARASRATCGHLVLL